MSFYFMYITSNFTNRPETFRISEVQGRGPFPGYQLPRVRGGCFPRGPSLARALGPHAHSTLDSGDARRRACTVVPARWPPWAQRRRANQLNEIAAPKYRINGVRLTPLREKLSFELIIHATKRLSNQLGRSKSAS